MTANEYELLIIIGRNGEYPLEGIDAFFGVKLIEYRVNVQMESTR